MLFCSKKRYDGRFSRQEIASKICEEHFDLFRDSYFLLCTKCKNNKVEIENDLIESIYYSLCEIKNYKVSDEDEPLDFEFYYNVLLENYSNSLENYINFILFTRQEKIEKLGIEIIVGNKEGAITLIKDAFAQLCHLLMTEDIITIDKIKVIYNLHN